MHNLIHTEHEISESIIRQQDFERRLQTLPSKNFFFCLHFLLCREKKHFKDKVMTNDDGQRKNNFTYIYPLPLHKV